MMKMIMKTKRAVDAFLNRKVRQKTKESSCGAERTTATTNSSFALDDSIAVSCTQQKIHYVVSDKRIQQNGGLK